MKQDEIFLVRLKDHEGDTFLFKAKASEAKELSLKNGKASPLLVNQIIKDLSKYYTKKQAERFKIIESVPLKDIDYIKVGDYYN